MSVKYVIFDFDGTIVDTGEGILKSLQFAFEDHNKPIPTIDDLKKFIGPPLFYSFKTFYNIPEEKVQSYIDSYRKRYRAKGIYEVELYDGMKQLLETLREKGIKIGVASSKPQHLIFDVSNFLEITDLFDAVSGTAFDDSNHSGKADLITHAMELLGAENKDEVIMVGDRYFDIDGAHGAGVKSVGALFGYGSREEFEAHNADYIISHPLELLGIINE